MQPPLGLCPSLILGSVSVWLLEAPQPVRDRKQAAPGRGHAARRVGRNDWLDPATLSLQWPYQFKLARESERCSWRGGNRNTSVRGCPGSARDVALWGGAPNSSEGFRCNGQPVLV